MSGSKQGSIRLVALASLIGTTIEWYDFFLYETVAALVSPKLFFPTFDPLSGTLASLATYSVGFIAWPIGGIVIGQYGDRIGRRSMLVLTLVIMSVATFLIGLLQADRVAMKFGSKWRDLVGSCELRSSRHPTTRIRASA